MTLPAAAELAAAAAAGPGFKFRVMDSWSAGESLSGTVTGTVVTRRKPRRLGKPERASGERDRER